MKKFIHVRHAKPENIKPYPLTKEGRAQAESLAKTLKDELGDIENLILFSSPKTRAVQTAEYIAEAFGVETQIHEAFDNDCFRTSLEKLIEIADSYDVVIVVGHLYEVRDVPNAYARQVLKKDLPEWEVEYAEGVILDCEAGSIRLVAARA